MRVKLGIWHNEYAVYMDRKLIGAWSILIERRHDGLGELVIGTDNAGVETYEHRIDGEVHIYGYPHLLRQDRPADCEMSRCALMEVTMKEHASGLYAAILPADNLFPWPRTRDCKSYVSASELFDECVKRRAYSKRYGGSFTPPTEITKLLTPTQRRRLFAAEEIAA